MKMILLFELLGTPQTREFVLFLRVIAIIIKGIFSPVAGMTDLAYNACRYFLKSAVTENMNLNRCCYSLLIFAAIGCIFTAHPLVIWFLLANLLTLLLYGVDKMAARKDWRRVPESTLLVFGVVGGWGGAIAGQQIFRHKTQKQPFKTYFIISVIVSISVMGVVYQFYPFLPS